MKLRYWIGILGIAAMLAPMLAIAEDPPVPLPRRADRMPQGIEQLTETPAPADVASVDAAADPATADESPAVAATASVAAVNTTPQPVTLMAKITDDGNTLPDGVTWRVFETRTDAAGDLVLAQKSDDATAHLELPPGS